MDAVNIFSAENLDGRIDVARAVGSTATVMFIYDLAPGRSSSPYHYEYGRNGCSSSTARSWCGRRTASTP